ncbi:MAG: hypothetical protein WA418_05600 [Bradyrhizobium sp.]
MSETYVPKVAYVIPVVEGPEMQQIFDFMRGRVTCGRCNAVGCSWCNASVPSIHMSVEIVRHDATKE